MPITESFIYAYLSVFDVDKDSRISYWNANFSN